MSLNQPSAAPIPAIPPGVKLTTLENGLTIIVREDHSAPVVSAQAWCMAGSIHEGKWLGAGPVPRAGAHALQRHHHPPRQPHRPGSPGSRRLHERLHVVRPHRLSYRRPQHRAPPSPSISCATSCSTPPCRRTNWQGKAGHRPRDGHEPGRPGPPRQPAPLRDRLHPQPLSFHDHRLPGHL